MSDIVHDHISPLAKHLGDGASVLVTLGTVIQILPAVAALFTIVWTGIRIYETDTIQKLLKNKKDV